MSRASGATVPQGPRQPPGPASMSAPGRPSGGGSRRPVLALPAACALLLIVFGLLVPQQPALSRSLLGAGGLVLTWSAALYAIARRRGRTLRLDVAVRRHHWLQASAQVAVLLYWGWHVRFVYAFLPLIVAQLVFAYAVDSLVTWSRRDSYPLGFGPWPVILSINLFLWFRLDWFHWQFAMILVGYAGKEFIRWTRDGRSAHIFNPSSLPLALFSLVLILTGSTGVTLGPEIASTQFYPPHIYLVIFLAALPGQFLFGVVRMTMPAAVTMYAISLAYLQVTGTYLFYDTHIPVAIFLGMHLLFTDPSTAPRSESGRILFGVLYAVGTTAFYLILGSMGVPTFYDKLLPVPLMNLMVRGIDRLAASRPLRWPDPARLGRAWTPARRNLVYVSIWAAAFLAMSGVGAVGDSPPGQSLPFWRQACAEGNARGCRYVALMTRVYCDNGSGWACNESGIRLAEAGRPAASAFTRGCDLGFPPACANAERAARDPRGPWVRAAPSLDDLPIVLRGTKPPLFGRPPDELHALACRQGWRLSPCPSDRR